MLLVAVLAIILLGGIGMRIWASWGLRPPLVTAAQLVTGDRRDTLFVLVHGFEGGPHTWRRGTTAALVPHGDVLILKYPAGTVSNADADEVSRGIVAEIRAATERQAYNRIILVGHSMGALLTRKAFLYGAGAVESMPTPAPWAAKVHRIVLMAGTNRGWDISGQKPTDMGWMRYLEFWAGSWLG